MADALTEDRIAVARLAKAKAIARYVLQSAVDALQNLTDEEWLALAAKSGVNAKTVPSAESKALVMELLRGAK